MTHLSVWCAGPWWRASARKFDFRHNISQISHETFRRCVWWKDYQNPPFSFSSAAFCLFGMEGGGGWWRSFQGLSGPEQPGARQNNAFEIEGSVETLPLRFVTFCQGKGACAVALWGRRIVVTSGCWCVVAWHISTDRTLKKLSPFQCMTSLRQCVTFRYLLHGNLKTVLWRGWRSIQRTSSNRLYVWGLLTFYWLCCESTFQMQGHCDCVYFLPKDFAKTMIPW